jgi:hypothetical protein
MGKEADVIYPDASYTHALGRREVAESDINAYANDP